MAATVTLKIVMGEPLGKEYVFEEYTLWVVGRSSDCSLQLPCDVAHQDVSRHHCLLAIDPPEIRVRDLGSLNGTFLNGQKIGQRETAVTAEMPVQVLKDGDEIRVGSTTYCIAIFNQEDDLHEQSSHSQVREELVEV